MDPALFRKAGVAPRTRRISYVPDVRVGVAVAPSFVPGETL